MRGLPIGADIALQQIGDAGFLHVTLTVKGASFLAQPGNVPLPAKDARYLIRKGLVEPVKDGLLDAASQTYRLKK